MLETNVPLAKDDSDAVFIDRSAKHFDLILNFMRDEHVELPESFEELEEIQNEAQHYLLDGLMAMCMDELERIQREKFRKQAPVEKKEEDDIKVLETNGEMFKVIANATTKPVLIIYYLVDSDSEFVPPEGFIREYLWENTKTDWIFISNLSLIHMPMRTFMDTQMHVGIGVFMRRMHSNMRHRNTIRMEIF